MRLRTRVSNQNGYFSTGLIENKGQLVDDNGKATPRVLFKASVGAVDVYITTTGITYVFTSAVEQERKSQTRPEGDEPEGGLRRKLEWRRIDMELLGASIRKDNVVAERPSDQGYSNYYLTHCPQGITGVRAFHSVTIRAIYPGIDWRLSEDSEKGLKQEFIVTSRAKPADIRMRYTGAGKVKVGESGRMLRIETTLAVIEEGALLSHQGDLNQPVESRYEVRDNKVGFVVSKYDPLRPLIIDPPMRLVWSTLYGGNGLDGPMAVTCDNVGNVYLTGYTGSTNLPTQATGSTYVQASGENFIVKFSFAGVRQWATYYGGTPAGSLHKAITADTAGGLYVTGTTGTPGNGFPTMAPTNGGITVQTTNAGSGDAFVLKFDAAGIRQWATLYGGNGNDLGNGIMADPVGDVYIVGETTSTNLPVNSPPGPLPYWQPAKAGNSDIFIVKYKSSGQRDWATYYGGSNYDAALAITWSSNSTSSSSVYITGLTASTNFPLKGIGPAYYQPTYAGGNGDAFMLAMTTNGHVFWSTYYGGTEAERGTSIVAGPRNDVYVTGYSTPNPNTVAKFFPTLNPGGAAYYQPVYNKPPGSNAAPSTSPDAFILRFNSAGTLLWATLFGGTGWDVGSGITIDKSATLYVTGFTASTNFPTRNPGGNGYFDGTFNGLDDVFVASFRFSGFTGGGFQEWTTYAGGAGSDFARGIFGTKDCMFVTGEFNSPSSTLPLVNPPGGAYYQTLRIADDGFVMKFCQ